MSRFYHAAETLIPDGFRGIKFDLFPGDEIMSGDMMNLPERIEAEQSYPGIAVKESQGRFQPIPPGRYHIIFNMENPIRFRVRPEVVQSRCLPQICRGSKDFLEKIMVLIDHRPGRRIFSIYKNFCPAEIRIEYVIF
jgi:hypothetical protein